MKASETPTEREQRQDKTREQERRAERRATKSTEAREASLIVHEALLLMLWSFQALSSPVLHEAYPLLGVFGRSPILFSTKLASLSYGAFGHTPLLVSHRQTLISSAISFTVCRTAGSLSTRDYSSPFLHDAKESDQSL